MFRMPIATQGTQEWSPENHKGLLVKFNGRNSEIMLFMNNNKLQWFAFEMHERKILNVLAERR
jgi:hypothetical protein